jgi:hypothetical protein
MHGVEGGTDQDPFLAAVSANNSIHWNSSNAGMHLFTGGAAHAVCTFLSTCGGGGGWRDVWCCPLVSLLLARQDSFQHQSVPFSSQGGASLLARASCFDSTTLHDVAV